MPGSIRTQEATLLFLVALGLCEMFFYGVLAKSGWNLDLTNPQRPEPDKVYAGSRSVFKLGNNTSVSKFSLISEVCGGRWWCGTTEKLVMREVNLLIRSEASKGLKTWSSTPRSHTLLTPFTYLILSLRHP